MKFIKVFYYDIRNGENIDLYLTIAVAVVVGAFGLLGIAQDKIAPLTLAILGLLAFTSLKSRHLFESLSKNLNIKSIENISLDNVFRNQPPNLFERLKKAKSIYHNGISLVGTSNSLLGVFSSCIERGGTIQLLLVDPDSKGLDCAAQRFSKHQDVKKLKKEIEHALENFSSLQPFDKNGLKIKLFQAVPAYSIWVIDCGTANAEIWVGLYSYRDNLEPFIHILPKRDKEMFDFFRKQFELMWDSSETWTH